MLSDEGMMRAANVISNAADCTIKNKFDPTPLYNLMDRLECCMTDFRQTVEKFEASVERFILDAPNFGD